MNNRLSKLEAWKGSFNKMGKKRGQIDVVDVIKIVAIIIIAYLLLKAIGVV